MKIRANSAISLLVVLFSVFQPANLYGQNLFVNGSMNNHYKGEDVVAYGWEAIFDLYYTNTPDLNDEVGPLITSNGYTWTGGVPTASPDGGTWQNVYNRESVTQTISGLTVGTKYYFRYYYSSQGIKGHGVTYNTPYAPNVTVTGASGYTNPENAGSLFSWNSYCGEIIATDNSITVTASTTIDAYYYLAYDGFYLSVTPFIVPQITRQPTDVTLCNIGTADFSIQSSNAGNFRWQLNDGSGWWDISDNDLYTGVTTNSIHINEVTALMNRYQYRCAVSVSGCIEYSSPATLFATAPLTPSVMITSSMDNICKEGQITFTALPDIGGSSPIFQWKKNNLAVGGSSNTYTDKNLNNGDVISCTLLSNANCLATSSATSNSITVSLFPEPVVELDKNVSLCEGNSRLLDAGDFASYLWSNGSTGRTLFVNSMGSYHVDVIDDNGCKGSDTTVISVLLPSPKNFLPADTSICSYGTLTIKARPGYNSHLWSNNSIESAITISQAELYWLEVTDNNNCKGRDSILVTQKNCQRGIFIPSAFTPNKDGKNDLFKPISFGTLRKYKFTVYNRWGQIVFETTDSAKGWDGNFKYKKQDSNVFTWICSYQFEGELQETRKGSVVLIY